MISTWKNSYEVLELISSWPTPRLDKLVAARRLAAFIRGGLLTSDIGTYAPLVKSIRLSGHAIDIVELDQNLREADEVSIKLAALLSLFHHDLLIDVDEFDEIEFQRSLSMFMVNKTVVMPHRFGRSLYDRFSSLFQSDRQDSLDSQKSGLLLQGAEQGVYQVGPYVSGPLGLISSTEHRIAVPSRTVPLWHCDNIGCRHLHEVRLNDEHSAFRDITDRIDSVAQNMIGPHSHWGVVLSTYEDDDYSDEFSDIFSVIQDCLSDAEARVLLVDLLNRSSSKSGIWSIIHSSKHIIGPARDAQQLVAGVSVEAAYQLIFVADNESIISSIDRLVADGAIVIPSTEIRRARAGILPSQRGSTTSSISSLGIRSDTTNPSGRLAFEVWQAYSDADRLADLSWKTVKRSGPGVPGDVLDYLTRHEPSEAVSELVLGSKDVSEKIFEAISFSPIEDDSHLHTSRILWKFGYSLPRFGNEFLSTIRHLDNFKKAVLNCSEPLSSADREVIRSAGVNLFVNLEWFLEHFVSYNVWWLSNDHSLTGFLYDVDVAVSLVAEVLPDGEVSKWDRRGGNALGTLLSYLSSLSDWISTLDSRVPTPRPSQEYPHYVDEQSEVFPFHFKEMWACYEEKSLNRYVEDFKEIASLLLRSELAGVRNGLDHFRRPEKFPSLDAMLACESRVRQAIELADMRRLTPKHWWLQSRLSDNVGRVVEVFVDERGEKLNVSYPSALIGLPEADYGEAVVIAPGNSLGQANTTILFRPVEGSEFVKMWEDYPARADSAGIPLEDNSAMVQG